MLAFSKCNSTALLLLLLLLCTAGISGRLLRQVSGDDGSGDGSDDGSGPAAGEETFDEDEDGAFGSLDGIDGSDDDFDGSNVEPDIEDGSQGVGTTITDSTSAQSATMTQAMAVMVACLEA